MSDVIDDIIDTAMDFGRVMRKRMMKSGKADLHMGQVHILACVKEQPKLTMSEIAEHMKVSSPTATSFVDTLVKLGLISRTHDARNRKLVRLSITKAGERTLVTKMAEKKAAVAELLSVLSAEDRRVLHSILKRLVSHSST
jgi:DNA-binding MarR family transcriptional regulator